MRKLFFYIVAFISTSLSAQIDGGIEKSKIEVLGADKLVYDQEKGAYQMCTGNVKFKHGKLYMDCDSARFYEKVSRIEAFGDIYIRQRDSLDLWGNYLEYDGGTKVAKVSKNVKLTDGKMTLTTDRLTYDRVKQTGYYTTGGNIDNGRDKLYSQKGTYYSRTKEFFFKDSVRLSNEDYVMTSDTLRYNTVSKQATFLGPTFITSDDNTIFCNYGWYNTATETSQFSKGSYIESKENKLLADSMLYDRKSGIGTAYRNIVLTDTVQNLTITGGYGLYNRDKKTSLIADSAMAIILIDDDSLFLTADSLYDIADSSEKRRMQAYYGTRLYKSDIQGVCDSLTYHFSDSTIVMYDDPVLWADQNQITGDTITVYRNKDGIKKLHSRENGFIIEQDSNGLFNQIKGKSLTAFFQEAKLDYVLVDGNGESIYYALENGEQYSGVNEIICSKMKIDIDTSNRVRTIMFYVQPKATFHPLETFPSSKSRLTGFDWKEMLKPKRPDL